MGGVDARENQPGSQPGPQPKFLEVSCKTSGKVRRFAAGTEARFALHLINRKLGSQLARALYIEAVKEGEEPVCFGPNAVLVNYGPGWELQTIVEEGFKGSKPNQNVDEPFSGTENSSNFQFIMKPATGSSSAINFLYIGKILVAFVFIFMLGGSLTFFLENLPRIVLFLSSFFNSISFNK